MARHDRIIAKTADAEAATSIAPPVVAVAIPAPAKPKSRRKQMIFLLVAVAALAGAGTYGRSYWTDGRFMISTNDAYVTSDVSVISSRVQGYVAEVAATENSLVTSGDVLVRLDDGDYRIALQVAQSRAASAAQTLNRIDAQIVAAEAGVAQAQAQHDMADAQQRAAQSNADRVRQLAGKNVAAQAQLDTAVAGLDSGKASVAGADAAIANAQAQVGVLRAQRAEALGTQHELALAAAQAQRNLDLTVLRAPVGGMVANLNLEVGDLVSPGARLAALVPLDNLYIEANFKETQLNGLGLGAKVKISIDALPDASFEGTLASIAPATGAVFSLLPADNATGNFTKVVQRVSVRIGIPQTALDAGGLRAGLSATVEVDTRTGTPSLAPWAVKIAAVE